jgi:hypothetical protein
MPSNLGNSILCVMGNTSSSSSLSPGRQWPTPTLQVGIVLHVEEARAQHLLLLSMFHHCGLQCSYLIL